VGLSYEAVKDEKTGDNDFLVKHTGPGLAVHRHNPAGIKSDEAGNEQGEEPQKRKKTQHGEVEE
jgi:hypothetical protein